MADLEYKTCLNWFKSNLLQNRNKFFEETKLREYVDKLGEEVLVKFENSDVSCPFRQMMLLRNNLKIEIEQLQNKTVEDFKKKEAQDTQSILVFYNESMEIFFENLENNSRFLQVNVNQREHRLNEFHQEAIKYFYSAVKGLGNQMLKDEYKQKLDEAIKFRTDEKLREYLKTDNEKKQRIIKDYTKTCIDNYCSTMRSRIDRGSLNDFQLSSLHEELKKLSKNEFVQKCSIIQIDNETVGNFLTEIDSEFEQIQNDFKKVEERMKASLEQSMTQMCQLYKRSMSEKFSKNGNLDEGKLLAFHNWQKNEITEKFKAYKTVRNEKVYKEFQLKLKEDMENFYLEFQDEITRHHSSNLTDMKLKFQNLVRKFEVNFDQKLKSFPKAESVMKFQQMSNRWINDALVQFKLESGNSGLVTQFEEQLQKALNDRYEQEARNRMCDEEIQNRRIPLAKKGSEKIYNAKMKDYLSQSRTPNELHEFHHTLRVELLNNHKDLNDTNRQELAAHIDSCFRAFEPLNSMNISHRKLIMGIDLGTTTCCVGVYRNKGIEVIRYDDEDGAEFTTPSYVAIIDGNPAPIVGKPALDNSVVHFQQTIFDSKRLIGKVYNDESVQKYVQNWPFDVMDHEDGLRIKVGDQLYSPEQISSMILTYLKDVTTNQIGETITEAVITVPAEFNAEQRKATEEAGILAGLTKVELLDEPDAAALAYFWKENILTPLTCLVFDFGGGTLDLSIVKYSNGSIEVLKTGGDKNLGGRDIDNNLIHYCFQKFKLTTGIDVKLNYRPSSAPALRSKYLSEYARLRCQVEKAKIQLSTNPTAEINLSGVQGFHTATGEQKVEDLAIKITRKEFESIPENQKIFERVQTVLGQTISSADLRVDQIERVLLVGGSSHIPKVKSIIAQYFRNDSIIHDEPTPNQTVARGAAIYAAQISGGQIQRELGICLSESVPLHIGIRKVDGSMRKIIEKGLKLPAKRIYTFYRKKENLNTPIEVYEGNGDKVEENNLVGRFYLDDIKFEVENELEIQIKISVPNNKELIVGLTVDGITRKYFINKSSVTNSLKEYI